MSLFKKNTPEPTRRQRIASSHEDQRPAGSFSYHARRSADDQQTGRQTQRAALRPAAKRLGGFWLQRFGLLILVIVAVICAISVLSLSTNPRINELAVSGSEGYLHSSVTYQQAAAKLLSASIWNHNKITVDTASVASGLQAQYPELESVSITLPLLSHRPVVYIQPARPALILNSTDGTYVLSSSGTVLLVASPDTIAKLQLPTVTDQSGLQIRINHEALTGGNVAFIQMVYAQLSAQQFTPTSMVLPAGASELDVHLSGHPYYIKFNLEHDDARQQAGTFLALISKLQTQNITPNQYVDVRVDGRAYYQ